MNPFVRFAGIFTAARHVGQAVEVPPSDLVGRKRASFKVVVIAITVIVSLTMIRYFGDDFYLYEILRKLGFQDLPAQLIASEHSELYRLGWWICTVVVFYLFVPMLVIKLILKENIGDYGMKAKGLKKDAWLYVFMLTIMIPIVLLSAHGPAFQAKYPYYQFRPEEGLGLDFWVWEAMYFFQFFTLEFFFRGFMLHGSKYRFGYYAIFFMLIPYVMIHFTKPMGETAGSVLAGIALGALSLKSNSIWMGTLLHYSVALLMDMAALYYKGML